MTTAHTTRPVWAVLVAIATFFMLSTSACGSGSASGEAAPTTTDRPTTTTTQRTTTTTERSQRTTTVPSTVARRTTTTVPATTETPVTTDAPTTTVPATTVPPPSAPTTSVAIDPYAPSVETSEASKRISIKLDARYPGSRELLVDWGSDCPGTLGGANVQELIREESNYAKVIDYTNPAWRDALDLIWNNNQDVEVIRMGNPIVVFEVTDDLILSDMQNIARYLNAVLTANDPCAVPAQDDPATTTPGELPIDCSSQFVPDSPWAQANLSEDDMLCLSDIQVGETYCLIVGIGSLGQLSDLKFIEEPFMGVPDGFDEEEWLVTSELATTRAADLGLIQYPDGSWNPLTRIIHQTDGMCPPVEN